TDGSGNQFFVPIIKSVQMIVVAPIVAQAGQIDVRADQLQGHGSFDAPTDINVSIVNHSIASLDIQGISIPQLLGGVLLNGVPLQDTNAGDSAATAASLAISAINNSNIAAAAQDNKLSMSSSAPAVAGTANFTFVGDMLLPVANNPNIYLT
ncbi:hypothetical protein QWT45_29850, partial [Escherichia coli]|uniref:hypothetical protein n=1 Tax=Escherichia coli TaxID=562 RepID=UPI002A7FF3A5